MNKQSGFSLVELLVVVIIIAIIAAIAIPNLLSSRRAANESTAVANLRTVGTANATFAATQSTNGYFAATFNALSAAPGLLDTSWVGAPVKNTYTFTYTVDAAASPTTYCVQAISADANAKNYGLNTTGVIYQGPHAAAAFCAAGVLDTTGMTVLGN